MKLSQHFHHLRQTNEQYNRPILFFTKVNEIILYFESMLIYQYFLTIFFNKLILTMFPFKHFPFPPFFGIPPHIIDFFVFLRI